MLENDCILLLDGNRGRYLPQAFSENYGNDSALSGVSPECLEVLACGPDHENYWMAWDECLDQAVITAFGRKYLLFQHQDLWAVPEGAEIPEML